jgi:putative oxidoreductase
MIAIYEALVPYTGYLALLLRVWVGANLVIHARPKTRKGAVAQAAGWLKGMGMPASAAYLATALELFGGIFLIIGLIVPIVAVLLIIQFAAISVMKKTKQHDSYIAPGKSSYEIDVLYLILAIVILVIDSGPFSLDALIGF